MTIKLTITYEDRLEEFEFENIEQLTQYKEHQEFKSAMSKVFMQAAFNVTPPAAPIEPQKQCNRKLWENGLPIPKSCEKCLGGPCVEPREQEEGTKKRVLH